MNIFYNKQCQLCPRLVKYRHQLQKEIPQGFNAPVQSFGELTANLLIIGLAPGKLGANFSGRPFTGDAAGDLLYATLDQFGLMQGRYQAHADDGVQLINCRITNAVKCVPPQNKPTSEEVNICGNFLKNEIASMANLQQILCLGVVSHNSTLKAFDLKASQFPFKHGACYYLADRGIRLYDSYHCSRYNVNTRRLTRAMFSGVFRGIMDQRASLQA